MISKVGNFKSNRGFTLFEVLIVIAIAALAMGAVVNQMGKALDWDFKSASRKLSGTIRYLYNKSVSDNVTFRLVFDFEKHAYWVESSTDPFAIMREEDESLLLEFQDKKDDEEGIAPLQADFGAEESYLLKPVSLPRGIYLKDIYAEHQIDKLSDGRAYIYFFPKGYVERSIINLRNEDDDVHYSLIINPISGRVKIEPQYTEPQVSR